MGRIILFLLMTLSLHAQSITVSGTTYQIMGDEMMSDPNTFLHQFIEDGNERGHHLDPNIRGVFEFIGGTGSTKGYSRRDYACRGSYYIALQQHYWDNYDPQAAFITGASNLFEQRRHLAYHELGHALLRYNHVCHGEVIQLGRPTILVEHDIMFSARSCAPSGYSYTSADVWENLLDRFFNTDLHTTHPCSNSRKSNTPILDY